jgi:hypothetical protein
VRRALVPLLAAAVFVGSAAAASVRGSAHADLLRGTPSADRIVARAGNDRIDVAFGGVDSVSCGPGSDLVVADGADRVASDCETVVRRISVDPFTNAASQHSTAVEPDSFAWRSTVVATFQVGRFKDGGASGIGFAVSRDAGRTWRSGVLPQLTEQNSPPGSQSRASDPSVAYDAAHGTWLVSTLGLTTQTDVAVSRSADGLHWTAPVQLAQGTLLDKEWIACDNGTASPFRGRCYVAYTDDALHRMSIQASDDGGATWTQPARVTTDLLGAQPEIRPDGSLVILAVDLPDNSDRGSLLALRSTDGGVTFEPGVTVANFTWHAPPRMRAVPLPSAAVSADGTVSVVIQGCAPATPACSTSDVLFASSPDGVTWSPLRSIAHGSTDRFVVGLDADPAHLGRLALVYTLMQPGTCAAAAGCRLGIAFQRSTDGGTTWTTPRRLDAAPFGQTWVADAGGAMLGDYYSVSYAGGRVVPVFTLAEPPLAGRLREAIFAVSLPG